MFKGSGDFACLLLHTAILLDVLHESLKLLQQQVNLPLILLGKSAFFEVSLLMAMFAQLTEPQISQLHSSFTKAL